MSSSRNLEDPDWKLLGVLAAIAVAIPLGATFVGAHFGYVSPPAVSF